MDVRKYLNASFVTYKDVAEGPMPVTIMEVAEGKYDKPDVKFEENVVLSANTTNLRLLEKAYGFDTEAWIGKRIELCAGEVEYQGRLQPSVLVKPISPPTPRAPATTSSSAEMNDELPY